MITNDYKPPSLASVIASSANDPAPIKRRGKSSIYSVIKSAACQLTVCEITATIFLFNRTVAHSYAQTAPSFRNYFIQQRETV